MGVSRICNKCGVEKPIDEYNKSARYTGGYTPVCKKCRYDQINQWRKKTGYVNEYYKKNREKLAENQRKYNQRNKAKRKALTEARRQKQRQCTPPWLTEEHWVEMENFYWLAKDLQAITGEPYEVDHIIPLNGEIVSGLHVPWNLQVLPKDVNRRKSNKLEST